MTATAQAHALLLGIRQIVASVYGERFAGIVLYGSEARGTALPDSDIDLLILLKGEVAPVDDIAALDVLYPLMLDLERPIHASCVSLADYEAAEYPLYRNAKAEGLVA